MGKTNPPLSLSLVETRCGIVVRVFNQNGSGILVGWEYTSTGYAYAAYQLSGGSLYIPSGDLRAGNQGNVLGLYQEPA